MQHLFDDMKIVFGQLKRWLWFVVFLLPVFYLASGFYSVGIDQRAFVTRFGKLIQDNIASGMHYHLPWPAEQVFINDMPSLKSKIIVFKVRHPKEEIFELVTGDGNLVDSQIEVQYSVSETMKFVTVSKDTDRLLEELAKSEVIYHISHNKFANLLTTGRTQFQERIKSSLQETTTNLGLGLRITGVQIKLLEPPKSIKNAFDDVSSAQSEKQKMIQDARGERGTKLARARSKSNKTQSNARALSNEWVKRAEGDVNRFESQLGAMSSSDKLFIKQAYLESLEMILHKAQVVIISPE